MEVDVTRLQETKEKTDHEKQQSEGWCFLCNKQGHLKKNCPQNEVGALCMPMVQMTQLKRDEVGNTTMQTAGTDHPEVEEVLTKLRGMDLKE
jgi:hypothetical protein